MKLTVSQLKQLVRESVEEMHQMHPDDDDMDHHEMHHGEHGDDEDYSHEEDMEDLIDQHGHDADEADREAMTRQEEDDLMRTPEGGEDLSSRSGMGRRLSESLKLVIREVIEECGCALEEEAIIEELMEKKMGFKKLTKSLAAKGAKNPKGLAYWIGKKKFGKAEMTKRAVEGKKKASK